jgi:predicted AAA+ superfamily ATPase
MLGKREILEILTDWNLWGNYKAELIERKDYIRRLRILMKGRGAVVIKGVRRSGKSSLTYLLLKKLLEDGPKAEDTLVVNLEDPRFPSILDNKMLMSVYETYLEALNPSERHIVVLDEVQPVRGWERFVRYLSEAKKTKVIVTGSSSKLLSDEYSTLLAGRYLDVEVFPLAFREFLDFKGIRIKDELDAIKSRHKIKNLLSEYIEFGGFPEVALAERKMKGELIRRYFTDIIIKDVTKRFGIKEIDKLEGLAKIYLSNISILHSFNKLKNVLGISLDTVERFSKYLNTVRLIFLLPKFSYSIKQQILTQKKVYCIDTGFVNSIGFRFSENLGRIAENLVFLQLLRRKEQNPSLELYYWRDYHQREVDFVIKEGTSVKELIQVCWDLADEETKRREIKGLLKAMDEFRLKKGLVITEDFEGKETLKGKGIVYTPLWKWLLQK